MENNEIKYELTIADKTIYLKEISFVQISEVLELIYENFEFNTDKGIQKFLELSYHSGDKEIYEDEEYYYFIKDKLTEFLSDYIKDVEVSNIDVEVEGKIKKYIKFSINDIDVNNENIVRECYIKEPSVAEIKILRKMQTTQLIENGSVNALLICNMIFRQCFEGCVDGKVSDTVFITNNEYLMPCAIRMIDFLNFKHVELKKKF